MKEQLCFFTLMIAVLFSCKKEKQPIYRAKANFSVSALFLGTNYKDNLIKVGTHDELSFQNQSDYADSVLWNFGNQHSSNSYDATYAYASAGIYTVTLTVFNHNGTKSTYSRTIQAMERVIQKVTIGNIVLNRFYPYYNNTHTFAKADLWVEVKFDEQWAPNSDAPDGSIVAPVIYTSPVFRDVDSSFHGSLTYELPQTPKVVINYPVRNATYPLFPSTGRGTIVELYGRDASGTYLLGTSWGAGLHLLSGGGNPATSNTFDLGYSVPDGTLANQVKLDCMYQ